MSKAFECDRCGEFFNPAMMEEHELFTTIHGYGRQSRTNYNMNECWDRVVDDVHLCPGCTKDFRFFMNGGNPDDEIDQDANSSTDRFCDSPPPSGLRHVIDGFKSRITECCTDSADALAQRAQCPEEDSEY